jgi:hypothetical protein
LISGCFPTHYVESKLAHGFLIDFFLISFVVSFMSSNPLPMPSYFHAPNHRLKPEHSIPSHPNPTLLPLSSEEAMYIKTRKKTKNEPSRPEPTSIYLREREKRKRKPDPTPAFASHHCEFQSRMHPREGKKKKGKQER